VSETIDWARTLLLLHAQALDEAVVRNTLNVLIKRQSDVVELQDQIAQLTQAAVHAPALKR
jgi:hypothetical protein